MTTLLKKLETDLSTVRLDFNTTSATGLRLLGNVDMGTVDANAPRFIGGLPTPDAWQSSDQGLVEVNIRLKAVDTTIDNLNTIARNLATELMIPGPFLWQPHGAASALYFDALKSDIPALHRDDGDLHHFLINKLTDPMGLPVKLWRMPFFYGAKVTGTPTAITNDPASSGKRMTVSVTGNAPTRAMIKIAPAAGSVVQARIARRSYGSLSDFRSSWFVQGESATTGTDITLVSDAAASGGGNNVANITFASVDSLVRRLRWSISPTDKTGIEGTFRVYGRFKLPASTDLKVQLKWAASGADPVPFTNQVVPLSMGSATADFYVVDLGTVYVEHGLGTTYGLTLELWASRSSGSGSLGVDHLFLMPSGATPGIYPDQVSTIAVRGFRDEFGPGIESWQGEDLVRPAWLTGATAGTDSSGSKKLTENTDAAFIPPGANGLAITSGKHIVQADVTIKRVGTGTTTFGELAAYRTDTQFRINKKDLKFDAKSEATTLRKWFTIRFSRNGTSVTPHSWGVQKTAGPNATIFVHRIKHSVLRALGVADRLRLDGDYGLTTGRPAAFTTDSSDVMIEPLTQEGGFIDLYPGNNELCFDWGDLPADGADDYDVREPLPLSVLTRSMTVTVSYYPRYTH